MKVYGTIKQQFPVNTFTPVIFVDNKGVFFTQIESNNLIINFEPIELSRDEILISKTKFESNKNDPTIYCYTQEDNTLLFGTLDSLKNKMFELINSDRINTFAKVIISSKYKIHNKTADFIEMSNLQFQKEQINCRLHLQNYVNVTEYKNKNLETIYNSLYKIKSSINKKSNIEWADFINISDSNFFIDKFKIDIDFLFSTSCSNKNEKQIKQKLLNIITHRIENKKLNKNVLINNKKFYPYLLSFPIPIPLLDKVAFTIDVPDDIKYKSEVEFEKYIKENEENNNMNFLEFEKIFQQAEMIKKHFTEKDEHKI